LGTSGEAFGNSGEQIGKKGVKKQKIPPTPSGKGKEQAHHEDMPSLPINCRKFIFPKLSVSIIFLGFVLVVELISSQFLHLFLSRFVCFGCLFLKGAWETNHSQPPKFISRAYTYNLATTPAGTGAGGCLTANNPT
jgi:hypothetical protein